MKDTIVHSLKPVLLVGGGEATDQAILQAQADVGAVVAADGGAAQLLRLGVQPDAVIGDMDSLAPQLVEQLPGEVLHRIAEQDSTDFDKCLRSIRAPLVLAHGFLGGRVDHQLAVLTVLARRADRRCVLVGGCDVICLAPPRLELTLQVGTRVSLYPLGPVRGRSDGLRWPIEGLGFAPDGRIGTSNEATTDQVVIEVNAPLMLLILPLTAQGALRAALSASLAEWPARAE